MIVDLSRVAELKGIQKKATGLDIGAMTTHDQVANSADVRSAIPGLCEVAAAIGDPHVRNRGTIGGSVANNDPAADYPAALLALAATIVTNKREIAADDFFKGLFSTALDDGEIVTRISFPIPGKFAYVKFANPASRYALVGVAVANTGAAVRVAVTGAGSNGVFRHKAAETALTQNWSAQALANLATNAADMMSDIHADADLSRASRRACWLAAPWRRWGRIPVIPEADAQRRIRDRRHAPGEGGSRCARPGTSPGMTGGAMAVTMSGEVVLPADKATVWARLNDAETLQGLDPRLREPGEALRQRAAGGGQGQDWPGERALQGQGQPLGYGPAQQLSHLRPGRRRRLPASPRAAPMSGSPMTPAAARGLPTRSTPKSAARSPSSAAA